MLKTSKVTAQASVTQSHREVSIAEYTCNYRYMYDKITTYFTSDINDCIHIRLHWKYNIDEKISSIFSFNLFNGYYIKYLSNEGQENEQQCNSKISKQYCPEC